MFRIQAVLATLLIFVAHSVNAEEYCGYTEDRHHSGAVVCLNQYACYCNFPSGNSWNLGANQSKREGCNSLKARCEKEGGKMEPELITKKGTACTASFLNNTITFDYLTCQVLTEYDGTCEKYNTYNDCEEVIIEKKTCYYYTFGENCKYVPNVHPPKEINSSHLDKLENELQ